GDAAVDARPERAVDAQAEPAPEVWQTDQDDGQQRLLVPGVVGEDVQVLQDVVADELGLVEEKDRVDALARKLLDVVVQGPDAGGGGLDRQPQREAELAVEVAAAEGGVVAVGEAKAGLGQLGAQRAQGAGLADAGLADDDGVVTVGEGLDQVVDDVLARRGQP